MSETSGKWRVLYLLGAAELPAMALWFSSTAVIPQLTAEWELEDGGESALTISVQLGLVPGALLPKARQFSWRHAGSIVTDRPVRFANLAYLGHM